MVAPLAEALPSLAAEWDDPRDISGFTPGSGKTVQWRCSTNPEHVWSARIEERARGARACPACSSIATQAPDLAAYWDHERNERPIEAAKPRSGFDAHWQCVEQPKHRWVAPVYKMTMREQICMLCISLAERHPDIAREWDVDANGSITPWDVTRSSGMKAYWRCALDPTHSWKAAVNSRTVNGSGCPKCSGRSVLPGINDLATRRPDLASQWDVEANGSVTPADVKAVSGDFAHWVCATNPSHRWRAKISNRFNGSGCPDCSGNRVSEDNSLATKWPEIAAQFVRAVRPVGLTPERVTASSTALMAWRCNEGHEFESAVYARTNNGVVCPVCANKKILEGYNDLSTTHPELAREWVEALDSPRLGPEGVTRGSTTVVRWQCTANPEHRWETTVASRTSAGSGCPRCRPPTSAAEDSLATVVSTLLGESADVLRSVRDVIPGELDVYVPARSLAVEFNGLYWHSERVGKARNYHLAKSEAAERAGLALVHVWEDDWAERRDIVVRAIAYRLGATEQLARPGVLVDADPAVWERLNARSLQVEEIGRAAASAFMAANHIQGPARSSLHIGLTDGVGRPRAVLSVMRSKGGAWTIERYATRGIVRGGFTRLLTAAERTLAARGEQVAQWVTYADGASSDGALYSAHGFHCEKFLAPDYRYVVGGQRVHKFNFRLKRFRTDPGLVFEEGMSEQELAQLNGLSRIWDCGKTRWTRVVEAGQDEGREVSHER